MKGKALAVLTATEMDSAGMFWVCPEFLSNVSEFAAESIALKGVWGT